MQKIVPHLWFDTQAKEAAQFYASTFGGDSKVTYSGELHDTPSGDTDMVSFTVLGYDFMAISAGPVFQFNPSISFVVVSRDADEIDGWWKTLSEGGTALMPLGEYPFSEKYGWIQDKYGVSWQLMSVAQAPNPPTQRVLPTLMFVGDVCGKAEEAVAFYTTVFPDSEVGEAMRYGAGEEPDIAGTIKHVDFNLFNEQFAAMDSAQMHGFTFGEAVSLLVNCEDQAEIDRYWGKLSAVPEAEQCGWLKDKYGVSWQIVPIEMNEMMAKASPEQMARVTKAFLQMKKFDVAELRRAFEGK
ncbi:MAG TPA: VOC family protein [Candidatus Saccharimonadales bacterium]|nr:VOC family protein [Candidatus Saccharimonadales bacterium]